MPSPNLIISRQQRNSLIVSGRNLPLPEPDLAPVAVQAIQSIMDMLAIAKSVSVTAPAEDGAGKK